MWSLPVIVGCGGVNPAGRSSFHHGFGRVVYDALDADEQAKVRTSLARMMGIPLDTPGAALERRVLGGTLVRTIERSCFDTERLYRHKKVEVAPTGAGLCFRMDAADLPNEIPAGWTVRRDGAHAEVTVADNTTFFVPDYEPYSVRVGGQLPTGFEPGAKHKSKSHPRGLQLAIYGASAAVQSVGIPWKDILARVPGDKIAVYASSAMGQLDWLGAGQMLRSHTLDRYTSSRNCPFGLPQMPADFVNAYVIGSIGRTAGLIGACATFLYNLEKAVHDIQQGIVELAVVGAAEAPLLPEVLEGYRAMGALADDPTLLELDGLAADARPDHRRASRPFADNCGFVMGESTQYLILMSDALAVDQGATIYGAVPDVFIHADGPKTSISSPGIGNYFTLGKACAFAADILGDRGLRERTFVHAHGTSTPQNRVTESHVFDRIAAAHDIRDWVVAACKCFVGHSLGAAAGDATAFALGSLATGIVPGITTATEFAEDIHGERLSLSNRHREFGADHWQAVFVNSKGFGGNNATGIILAPGPTRELLAQRLGAAAMSAYASKNEQVSLRQKKYEDAILAGDDVPIYDFGNNVVAGEALEIGRREIHIPSFVLPVNLEVENPYGRVG